MKTTYESKQKILAKNIFVIACLSAVLGSAGCQQEEGTAEKAGKEIDRAAEKASQNIDAAKDSLSKKASEARGYLGESIDASKEKLEAVDQKIETAKESLSDKAETAEEYIDDSVITMKVKTALLNDPLLNASQIEVITVNGVVKLSGTVDSRQSIDRAVELAKNQKNVKSVATDLSVN